MTDSASTSERLQLLSQRSDSWTLNQDKELFACMDGVSQRMLRRLQQLEAQMRCLHAGVADLDGRAANVDARLQLLKEDVFLPQVVVEDDGNSHPGELDALGAQHSRSSAVDAQGRVQSTSEEGDRAPPAAAVSSAGREAFARSVQLRYTAALAAGLSAVQAHAPNGLADRYAAPLPLIYGSAEYLHSDPDCGLRPKGAAVATASAAALTARHLSSSAGSTSARGPSTAGDAAVHRHTAPGNGAGNPPTTSAAAVGTVPGAAAGPAEGEDTGAARQRLQTFRTMLEEAISMRAGTTAATTVTATAPTPAAGEATAAAAAGEQRDAGVHRGAGRVPDSSADGSGGVRGSDSRGQQPSSDLRLFEDDEEDEDEDD